MTRLQFAHGSHCQTAAVDTTNWAPDKVNSISSATGRLVVNGTRAAEVRPESTSKTQIAALMDLLDLHLSNVEVGRPVDPQQVTLRVPSLANEARGALGTLSDALRGDIHVNVEEQTPAHAWAQARVGWDQADLHEYGRWPELLARARPLPTLVAGIVEAVNDPALRAYPLLSTKVGWSLRLEGLEVARATSKSATLNVGKDSKTGTRSLPRGEWIAATGQAHPVVTDDPHRAAGLIASFASAWRSLATTRTDQDEHALESRILRGNVTLRANDVPLALIQPHPVVNWGSQFPTKWGPAGKPRYLDALLRDGSTPWAIEMKVQGGAGVGQYYRHAVAQAVLYREFIRQATPLHSWFDERGLNAKACEAAVVVPRLTNPKQLHWRDRVARLCDAFEVVFIEVDPEHARRH